ncbi:hypothetical protein LCGC14_0845750 [marine sediment metagenome]|uniref:Uncharacterized protein n=1 Tax=marine sediment metagenome TaxID=412755 RepID=A0A0F9PGM1_9ZZZZ
MRPENWDAERIARENLPRFKWGSSEYEIICRGIEIGADAYEEALKEAGVFTYGHHTPDIRLDDAPEESGYWVFIPDE